MDENETEGLTSAGKVAMTHGYSFSTLVRPTSFIVDDDKDLSEETEGK